MKIAVIDAYHEFHYEVLESLQNALQCEYPYIIAGTSYNYHGSASKIQEIVERITAQDTQVDPVTRFIYPAELDKLAMTEWTVDEKMITDCRHIENYFLRLTDRNAVFPIPVHIRRQYYLILLNYFNHIIRTKHPDLILAFDTPHSYSSYSFYLLARHYNIPIVRLEHHFIENHSIMLTHTLPSIPSSFREGATASQLWDELPALLRQDFGTYSQFIATANANEKKKLIGRSALSNVRLAIRYAKKASANLIMGTLPFLFKREILHFTSLNDIRTRFFYRLSINTRLFRLIRLHAYYNRVSGTPDLSRNYIFFGMHMQPEKTSQPLGGDFDHQLFPILLLAQSLPDGWMLYVKEHPNQFNERKIANANYRNTHFYDAVRMIPNVSLVSLETPSNELIAKAKIVATLTGTLGWEGLKSGKPVIAFGNSYYKPCRAVKSPLSVEECRKDIADLLAMDAEDVKRELYRYLAYFSAEGYLVRAANWEEKFANSKLSREEQIDALSKAIIHRINSIDVKG